MFKQFTYAVLILGFINAAFLYSSNPAKSASVFVLTAVLAAILFVIHMAVGSKENESD